MQISKRAVITTGLSGALLSLAGCAALPHEPTEKYVLVTTNTKLPYWQNALAGLNHAATEMKVKAEMVGPDTYDPKAEHDEFQRAVSQKPTGIMISAADAALLSPDINSALAQGVPVLTMDSDAPESKRLFFIATNNYNVGTMGGHLVSKLLNGKGNVVIFTMPTQPNLKDRLHGYQDALSEHNGIKISQIVDMKGDPTVAFDAAKQMVDSKAKVDAFVCLEAIACPEVGEVVNRAQMGGKVVIVAMDTDQRTIDWISKGIISATIAQKPYTMGYYGAKLLDDLHHHPPTPLSANWAQNPRSPLPTYVDTGSFVLDKESISSFNDQSKAGS